MGGELIKRSRGIDRDGKKGVGVNVYRICFSGYSMVQRPAREIRRSLKLSACVSRTGRTSYSPLRPPVKNIFTMKTCSPAIATMRPPSMRFKLKILFSVLLTVLKLRFSLVRKYFCCLVNVETCPDIFKSVSSTPPSCSVLAPAFWGRFARGSFSTCSPCQMYAQMPTIPRVARCTHRNLKVHNLVRKGRHRVVEAEPVLSCLLCCEHIVSLPLFLAAEHNLLLVGLLSWSVYMVVDYTRMSACSMPPLALSLHVLTVEVPTALDGEVEGDL